MAYIGTQPFSGQIVSEFFSGTSAQTTFTLGYPYGPEASLLVFIDGIRQATTTYALYNGAIEFTEAPPTGSNNIEIVYLGGNIVTDPIQFFVRVLDRDGDDVNVRVVNYILPVINRAGETINITVAR